METKRHESNIGKTERSHITDVTTITWTILNFERYFSKNNGVKIKSEYFSIFTPACSWRFLLFPKGSKGHEGYMSLFIKHRDGVRMPLTVINMNIAISMTNNNNARYTKTEGSFEFHNSKKIGGFPRFARRNDFFLGKDTLPNDYELTIHFTMTKCKSDIFTQRQPSLLAELDEFEKLLEHEKFCDCTLIVDGKEIKVHKAILANRSPVFSAMFEHEMKEKIENKVEIKDIRYGVMKELLRFVYAAKVNNIENIAAELLYAAERYSIDGLKTLCEKFLGNILTNDNVLMYLIYADMLNAYVLKSSAINFIVSNSKDIVCSPTFELLGKTNGKLMCEVMRVIVLNEN